MEVSLLSSFLAVAAGSLAILARTECEGEGEDTCIVRAVVLATGLVVVFLAGGWLMA